MQCCSTWHHKPPTQSSAMLTVTPKGREAPSSLTAAGQILPTLVIHPRAFSTKSLPQ